MPSNQNLSPPEKASGAPVPSLDESLAQLEVALDLFVNHHADGQYPQKSVMEEAPSITPITSASKITDGESAPVVATPIKEESFEQAIKDLKQKIASPVPDGVAPPPTGEVVIRTPDDEDGLTQRRFPLFTDAQKKLMLLTVVILAFFALIGYLIWQRQKTDELRLALEKQENAQLLKAVKQSASEENPVPIATAPPLASGDQTLLDHVKQILVAYNPTAANTRYKIDVTEGVITLNGEVQSQLEKDGVENVIKPLSGIKKIVNNLAIKGLLPSAGGAPVGNGPVMFPQVNPAEAKRLEEALKRDLAEGAKRAEDERLRIEQQNSLLAAQRNGDEVAKQEAARQEAERLQRQQTATIHNDEDAAFRKIADERLKQREKEEAARRADEQRKAEAVTKAEPARIEGNVLRSGTITWRGAVKGVDDIVIRGSSATVQHVSGDMPKDTKGVFSAAIPNAPISVRLVAASGPAPIRIIQQPSASNNYTTIVRVGDGGKGEGKSHTFTLRWSSQ